MQQLLLKVEKREGTGKEKSAKIRQNAEVPGVIYGKGFENLLVKIPERELARALKTGSGMNVIINLEIDGKLDKDFLVMVSELQRDVFQKSILHVDFHKISLDQKVYVSVPVKLTGECPGVKEGGVVDHLLWQIDIEALPLKIPESIEADISGLAIGDALYIKDIKFPEGVEPKVEAEEAIVIIHAPKAEEVAVPAEGEAIEGAEGEVAAAPVAATEEEKPKASEPEVIKKGKKEEGE
ncbi:MAG: 50S ribosomal protein L25 [Armatimonadota bacterium]